MGKILIDTSIIIDHLRLKNKKQTILYRLFQNKHSLFASILTHTESYAGKSVWEKESVRNHLKNILAGIRILPLEENVSEKAGEIRVRYNLGIVDAIIAATSMLHGLNLATLNIKDFKKIKGLKLFKN
ncbi:type II toxin-antitoxin system VapC family toxin [Candidatus Daviesbacteria bacterium]|nr:type II toxin-antitoxin system VapC family toxin [Candidatus Daviesbacteria bacterium]